MEYSNKLKDLNLTSTFNNIYRHCVYFHRENCFENFCDGLLTEVYFIWFWRSSPQRAMASSFTRFLDHTVGRTPLDEWSARRRPQPDNTQHSQQADIHAPGGIRTHNLSRRAAADLPLRPRGHWDRRSVLLLTLYTDWNCSVFLKWQGIYRAVPIVHS